MSSTMPTIQYSEPKTLGLSNPAQMNMIDELRSLGVGTLISLPQLVVVGDQSSGKSSVLEAIMQIPLPRDAGLCTRFATNITFHRAPVTSVRISIIPGRSCEEGRGEGLKGWKRDDIVTLDGDTFLSVLDEASALMGIIGRNEDLTPGKKTFSDDVLKIDLSGPERENLSIIDVPGIFRMAGKNTTEADMELVRNLVNDYIMEERTIILAVMPANVDAGTQEILHMAKKADPKGERTLGVLTKPDIVDRGGEQKVLDLVMGKDYHLALGYHVVRNRGQSELDSSSEARDEGERAFFTKSPWNEIPKERVGIVELKKCLSHLLAEIIRREFPKMKAQMDKKLSLAKRALYGLGVDRETADQQRRYLEEIAMKFQTIRSDAMATVYHQDAILKETALLRLPTLVANRNDAFLRDIARNGHLHAFAESPDDSEDEDDSKEKDSQNSEEEDDMEALSEAIQWSTIEGSRRMSNQDSEKVTSEIFPELQDILIAPEQTERPSETDIRKWIEKEYRAARGFELEVMNPSILPLLWQTQSANWVSIARSYINDIILMVHNFIICLLRKICTDERTLQGLRNHLTDRMLECYSKAIEQVEFILKVERLGTMITKNHYFADTIKKIRAERASKEIESASYTPDGEYHQSIRISSLEKIHTSRSNLEHAIDDLHTILKVYYKVARKRFVDIVIAQAADYFLLTGDESPLNILTPPFISGMTTGQLEQIAGEDMASKNKRMELKRQIGALEKGKKVLRG